MHHTENTNKIHARYSKIKFCFRWCSSTKNSWQLLFIFHAELCESRSFHSGSKLNNTALNNTFPGEKVSSHVNDEMLILTGSTAPLRLVNSFRGFPNRAPKPCVKIRKAADHRQSPSSVEQHKASPEKETSGSLLILMAQSNNQFSYPKTRRRSRAMRHFKNKKDQYITVNTCALHSYPTPHATIGHRAQAGSPYCLKPHSLHYTTNNPEQQSQGDHLQISKQCTSI